jgi:endonuclease/exonuclease/phosphatase family metal-dependent hydrolase
LSSPPRPARTRLPWLPAAVLLSGPSCATAENYLDPAGPLFEASFGEVRDAGPALRVVSFNVEHGLRLPQAVAALAGHQDLRGADVLLLQEMTGDGVEAIACALGMNAVYYPASRLKGRDLGNAVLSPWPIVASWKVPLPHLTRVVGNSRSAVAARLQVGGRTLVAYSVHLGSPLGLSAGRRRDQAKAVLADADRSPLEPAVVGGDFNSRGVGEVFVRQGFAWPTRSVGRTVWLFAYDHVFTRGLGSEGRAGVARDVRDASDHHPVWAVLPPLRPAGGGPPPAQEPGG